MSGCEVGALGRDWGALVHDVILPFVIPALAHVRIRKELHSRKQNP